MVQFRTKASTRQSLTSPQYDLLVSNNTVIEIIWSVWMNFLGWLLLISVGSMFYFHVEKQRDATQMQNFSRDHFVSIDCNITTLELSQKSNLSLGTNEILIHVMIGW